MVRFGMRLGLVCVLVVVTGGRAGAMTIQLGSEATTLVEAGWTWHYLAGTEAPSEPDDAWTQLDFDDSAWPVGPAGFGYGDNDDATVLADMQGRYVTLYIRTTFSVAAPLGEGTLELEIDYDDGFIAYLNGREIARRNVPEGPATLATTASSHEAGTPEMIALGAAADLLVEGVNVLAIEGHNASADSSDFSLIPALRTAGDTVRNGDTYIVTMDTVTLTGRTDFLAGKAGATGSWWVMVQDVEADANLVDGTWQAEVLLSPGLNAITAQAFGGDPPRGGPGDSGSIEILYVPPSNRLVGELEEDITLADAYIVAGTVTVPKDKVLKVEPGTVVLMDQGASLVVAGQLLADGTEDQSIRFTHYGDGRTWKQILFVDANDSRFDRCLFEYADSEGAHQDYYEEGPRDYHEAIVALACHIDVNDCVFRNLPDDSGGAEGDAIAIISDDPNHPGLGSAHITGCQFLAIGQSIHTRYSYVLVEDCFFTGKRGDNDDVDLWGESEPPPLVRNNVFLDPAHDDMINPTNCSAVLVGNVIAGSDDHGVVLRGRGFPVLMNNVIYDCSAAGVAVENSCSALLVNNTIVGCGRGLRLFDLGRWGPPYNLPPGGGTATVINCIIRDCPQPITLADSSNTEIVDRGSHVTVSYSDIEGGRAAISVSGSQSTVEWGDGNIDADPLFADGVNADFHLRSQSGRWDPDEQTWVRDDNTSPCIDAGDPDDPVGDEPAPNGSRINMGAYGGTTQASKSSDSGASE